MNKVKVRTGGGAVRLPYHGEDEEEQEAVDVDDAFADADGDDRGAVEACDRGEELFGVQVHGRLLMLLRVVGILRGLLRVVDAGRLGGGGARCRRACVRWRSACECGDRGARR